MDRSTGRRILDLLIPSDDYAEANNEYNNMLEQSHDLEEHAESPLPEGADEIYECLRDNEINLTSESEDNYYSSTPMPSPFVNFDSPQLVEVNTNSFTSRKSPNLTVSPVILESINESDSDHLTELQKESLQKSLVAPEDNYDSPISNSSPAITTLSNASTPMSVKKKRCVPRKTCPGKKRLCQKQNWTDVKRKKLLNLAKAYLSRNKNTRGARILKASCDSNCRYRCQENFPDPKRLKIIEAFWAMGNHTRQWDYVAKFSNQSLKNRNTRDEDSKRTYSVKYFLPIESNNSNDSSKKRVCKKTFLNTLSISNTFARTAVEKFRQGNSFIQDDARGKHKSHKRVISDDMKKSVIDHVNSYAPIESHYIRKDSERKYLDENLNFKTMFTMYNEWCMEHAIESKVQSLRQYRDVVNVEMNIGFFIPKKDMCDECHIFKIRTDPTTAEASIQNQHMKSKTHARELKNIDKSEAKESSKICTASFDFQKVLNLPHGEISILYYKRKLALYNFTVFDLANLEAVCYMWPQNIAKKGANEVSSCIFDYIQGNVSRGVTYFRFWSDNCGEKNRNRIVVLMFVYASNLHKINISHKFLVKGHTQHEGDSVHALIERNAKNKLIYTPDEYYSVVRWSKSNGKPYEVKEVESNDIYDFKSMLPLRQWYKNENKEKINWTKIKEIKILSDQPNIILYKYDINDSEYKVLNCKKNVGTRSRSRQTCFPALPIAYGGSIPIPQLKYVDLKFYV